MSERLSENIRVVRQQIADACEQARRSATDVQLVAVTKYVDTPTAIALARCLAEDIENRDANSPIILGENRPQVLQQRWLDWPADLNVAWHLIGHLQTNKIKVVVGRTALIHSLDRVDLIDKLNDYAGNNDLLVSGLLEFRLSADADKHGFSDADVPQLLERWPTWSNVKLCGVMGMSGQTASPSDARRQFEGLRETFVRIQSQLPSGPIWNWRELSMGMSGDLPQAIAAGATLVRIGSALFRGLLNC
ncbi:MAG: YggS family pyridoxal phosphate-dependent enzyme [Pirellulaceae bacterium]|nr:YggS family pyridoxal phosphate-dependent enzyme [Pirellulaceae bacterium]